MDKGDSVESSIELTFWKRFAGYFYVCFVNITGNDRRWFPVQGRMGIRCLWRLIISVLLCMMKNRMYLMVQVYLFKNFLIPDFILI